MAVDRRGWQPGLRLRLLSVLVLAVLGAASVAAYVVSRRVVVDQEERLLAERAAEVEALLSNVIDISIDASLRVLGPIGASPDSGAVVLFADSAGRLVEGATQAVGVAVADGDGFVVTAMAGEGPAFGSRLAGGRAALAARARRLEDPALVADLLTDDGGTRLVLARAVSGMPAVAFQEIVVDPTRPVASTLESPFRDLRAVLYASAEADPARLVVTTEAEVPLSGRVERVPFEVGADRWLLVVGARGSLVGSFASDVPWLFLAGGLVTAALATGVVETLTRRRSYALALVAERTAELETALEELAGAKAFVDRLVTAAPVVVGRARPSDQLVTYVSPNVARVMGLGEDQVRAPGFLASRIHPDDMTALGTAMGRVASGESDHELGEYRLRFGDSEESYRWIAVTMVPDTVDGEAAVLGYIVDVEDRRRAQDAQREAQAAAEAANRAKSEFLSRMSHELRTPLNAVLGFGQLLEIEPLTDSQRDAVDHILKGGRHLLDLINEVLDISRIEAGELSLSPEPVLVTDLVGEAVDLMRPLVNERGIQVVVDSSGACDCYVFADRQRAKQILLNLLSNAVKYNRPRGTVAISCEQAAAQRLRISVADTGVGIPAERLGQLFTPFERLGAEQTAEEGTGIGLALSQRLAEAMGGTLEAASTLGQGSTFTVELPRVEGPVERYERLNGGTQPAAAPAAPAAPATSRKMVLYIEDNLSNLTLVERILEQRPGVGVVAAMHGRLGLELAREHDPVLVLLDLHLPDMGGEDVLHRLRDDPATASIPVVIVSADATPGQIRRLLAAGAAGYLTKPIDVRELLRVLDDALTKP